MTRAELTEKIVTHKIMKGIKWADVAEKVGLSKEWVTAALWQPASASALPCPPCFRLPRSAKLTHLISCPACLPSKANKAKSPKY